jgi:prepilin-type N-terminal cleavage/methylation domain-containing protein
MKIYKKFMSYIAHKHKCDGFTLVEMAIVVLIVGLIVGGILRVYELIENTRVNKTVTQVEGYSTAIQNFRSAYNALAGDMRNATLRIPGCVAPCGNGDGNNMITQDGGDGRDWTAWNRSNIASQSSESLQFWKHLALADFINGVNPGASVSVANHEWGVTHPLSEFRGGFEFFHDCCTTIGYSSHFLRLSYGGLGGTVGAPGSSSVTPTEGAKIDRKMDDGIATRGKLVANYGGNGGVCRLPDNRGGAYREDEPGRNCTLFFIITNY